MKKLIAIITATIIIALCATACANLYPETAKVVKLDYENDLVIIESFNRYQFSFEGCEDWMIDDGCSLIMDDNGTETIVDDIIVMACYAGWDLVDWRK